MRTPLPSSSARRQSARANIRPADCRARQLRECVLVSCGICALCKSPASLTEEQVQATAGGGITLERALARTQRATERGEEERTMSETKTKRRRTTTIGTAERRAIVEEYNAALASGVKGAAKRVAESHGLTASTVSDCPIRSGSFTSCTSRSGS
jgi:hypothetical protein